MMKARLRLLLVVVAAGLTVMVAHAQVSPECRPGEYYASSPAGTFIYTEDEPNAPNTEGRIDFIAAGRIVWSVATWRGCSNGISVCQLDLSYKAGDSRRDRISFEMSFGEVVASEGSKICVISFSQMGESLASLHRKNFDQPVAFDRGRSDAPVLMMRDYLVGVPSIYQACSCHSGTS